MECIVYDASNAPHKSDSPEMELAIMIDQNDGTIALSYGLHLALRSDSIIFLRSKEDGSNWFIKASETATAFHCCPLRGSTLFGTRSNTIVNMLVESLARLPFGKGGATRPHAFRIPVERSVYGDTIFSISDKHSSVWVRNEQK